MLGMRARCGAALLAASFCGVAMPQAGAAQQFLTEARASGCIRSAIARAGLEGVDAAPSGSR